VGAQGLSGTLGEDGTQRRLDELRHRQEKEARFLLGQSHRRASAGSMAAAGNSVRCRPPKSAKSTATWFWEVLALIEREVIGKGARGDPDLIACL
jgi:hypothetical protein